MGEQQYMTIRQVANSSIGVKRSFLLRLQAEGKLAGYYAGTRFYVDVPRLKAYLEQQSMASVKA